MAGSGLVDFECASGLRQAKSSNKEATRRQASLEQRRSAVRPGTFSQRRQVPLAWPDANGLKVEQDRSLARGDKVAADPRVAVEHHRLTGVAREVREESFAGGDAETPLDGFQGLCDGLVAVEREGVGERVSEGGNGLVEPGQRYVNLVERIDGVVHGHGISDDTHAVEEQHA